MSGDDFEDLFDPYEAQRRRNAAVEIRREREERAEAERQREADERKRALERMRSDNEKSVLMDYQRAGVEPVYSGGILISLALLKKMGWTIEDLGPAGKSLTRPRGNP